MKIFSASLLFLALTAFHSFSQPTGIQWQKSLGGNSYEYGSCVTQTMDGGFVVAGYSRSNSGDAIGNHDTTFLTYDYWIVKLNAGGTVLWKRCFGGSVDDYCKSICKTYDGGYVAAGYTYSNDSNVSGNHGSYDYWIIKIDSAGNLKWGKCFGGTADDYAQSVYQTSDSGYVIAGFTGSSDGDVSNNHGLYDYWVIKLDTAGNLQWEKSFGGSNIDRAYSIVQTSDNGYVIAGFANSNDSDVTGNHGSTDCWIVKIDSLANLQWQKCFGGTSSDGASSVQQTVDGGFIFTGITYSVDGDISSNHGDEDFWVVKLDASGNLQLQKCLGGASTDAAHSVAQTTDGGYAIAGFTYSNDGDVSGNHDISGATADYLVIKINSSFNILWQRCYGGSNEDLAECIQQTSDDGFVVLGSSGSSNGNVSGHHGYSDAWLVKLVTTVDIIENNSTARDINIVPNPFCQSVTIRWNSSGSEKICIQVLDINGREVRTLLDGNIQNGEHFLTWNADDGKGNRIKPGIYFLKFITGNTIAIKKLILIE